MVTGICHFALIVDTRQSIHREFNNSPMKQRERNGRKSPKQRTCGFAHAFRGQVPLRDILGDMLGILVCFW
jgi:hypothetical protein